MYTTPLESIFTKSSLKDAYEKISKNSIGIDEVSFVEFEKKLNKKIQKLQDRLFSGSYSPEPLKEIEIPKQDLDEKRPIAISSIKDKIVQRVLYDALNPYFDKIFSNKSYAYRPNKSIIKAINRVWGYINEKNHIIIKTDIDNFFETIDHDKLLKILSSHIEDKRIVRLISLFLQVGGFKRLDYSEHIEGVHQGDILSPLLSNIYLDKMDKFLDRKNIEFIRYADDFVLFFKKNKHAKNSLFELKEFLKELNLTLEEKKTHIVNITEGFTFLGVRFEGKNRYVENERLQKSISKIINLSKDKSNFYTFIKKLNSYLFALKNHYLKIITKNSSQHKLLKDALLQTISHKIYLSKSSKSIKTKKEFRILLQKIELSIARGYELYLSNKSYKDSKSKIDKKKNLYAKKFANDTTLHIFSPGLHLGVSKNKFTLKEYGRVKKSFPLDKVRRIIVEGKGVSLSSDVIKRCAKNSITIDFIDRDAISYASLITHKASITQTIHKQALILGTPKQLQIASAFIKSKAKNQLNYLKYLNKYHKLLTTKIDLIQKSIPKIKKAKTISELMGIEGSISATYWSALKLVIEVPFEKRETQGAKDIVNSSLNYGYAILYGKVQHYLVYAGLSLNISFLHSLDGEKPTLAFDLIEEFRTFVVDRTIISMINRSESIKLDSKGFLTTDSRKLISKNIKEKLGSYTMYKKESRKVENLIKDQAYKLYKVVIGEKEKYKPFIGKF